MNSEKIEAEKENIEKDQKKIFITTKIKKHKNWTKDEDILLLDIADRFKQKSWTKVSTFFVDKNPAQCRARYKRIRPGIIKGAWAKEEDQTIIDFVTSNGKNWALISKMMPTRNGKQIRDRFLNYLDPSINRDKFTEEEDKKIIENYIEHGSKWSVIAKNFPGRTGDMIKNRFYSCLKRKIHVYDVANPKRIFKKYYKSKKIKYSRENMTNVPSKHNKYRFSIVTSNKKNEKESIINYESDGDTQNKSKEMSKTAELSAVLTSFNLLQNHKIINNSNEKLKLINDLTQNGISMYPEMGNSIESSPPNVNLNLEKNILNFATALSNLLNNDNNSKLQGTYTNEKENNNNNYYSEVLSKNIENLSTFNYIALSKILQLKQQIFQDAKSANSPDKLNNNHITDYINSINLGNPELIPFVLSYLQARSNSL